MTEGDARARSQRQRASETRMWLVRAKRVGDSGCCWFVFLLVCCWMAGQRGELFIEELLDWRVDSSERDSLSALVEREGLASAGDLAHLFCSTGEAEKEKNEGD